MIIPLFMTLSDKWFKITKSLITVKSILLTDDHEWLSLFTFVWRHDQENNSWEETEKNITNFVKFMLWWRRRRIRLFSMDNLRHGQESRSSNMVHRTMSRRMYEEARQRMNNSENTFKTIQLVVQSHWKPLGQCYPGVTENDDFPEPQTWSKWLFCNMRYMFGPYPDLCRDGSLPLG